MGLEVLQGDVIVDSPRYPRPSESMEAINAWIQLEGSQEAGKSGTDHGGRNRKEPSREGTRKRGEEGGTLIEDNMSLRADTGQIGEDLRKGIWIT